MEHFHHTNDDTLVAVHKEKSQKNLEAVVVVGSSSEVIAFARFLAKLNHSK